MPQNNTDRALLMLAHGSRDPEARKEYRRTHEALAARLAPCPVVFAVLEFPGDDGLLSIEDGWRQCLAAGARSIAVLPYFLFPAGHVREDLPAELREARESVGWAELTMLPPLGAAEGVLDAITARIDEVADTTGDGETALVLVGAGTSDPDANGDLCKAARLLWERHNRRFPLVETAWVSLTRPSVGEAIARCVRLGAARVILVPYFLNTGVLLKRVDAAIDEARVAHPTIPLTRAGHIGVQSALLEILERRARQGLEGGSDDLLAAACGRPSCTSVVRSGLALRLERAPSR